MGFWGFGVLGFWGATQIYDVEVTNTTYKFGLFLSLTLLTLDR